MGFFAQHRPDLELREILTSSSLTLEDKRGIAEELLKRRGEDNLFCVLNHGPEELKPRAWEIISSQKQLLLNLIIKGPDNLRGEAWEGLYGPEVDGVEMDDTNLIIQEAPLKYKRKAAQESQVFWPGTDEALEEIERFKLPSWGVTDREIFEKVEGIPIFGLGGTLASRDQRWVEIQWEVADREKNSALLFAIDLEEDEILGRVLLLFDAGQKNGLAVRVPQRVWHRGKRHPMNTCRQAIAWHHHQDPRTFQGFTKEV